MPSLQFDSPRRYDTATKRRIAQQMGQAYSRVMLAPVELVTVSIHDLGPGAVWRCSDGEPHEAALVMCDVRSGRGADTRAELARSLIAICEEHGGLRAEQVKVEFTQHPGDEMFHPHLDGFNDDWTPPHPEGPGAR